MRTLVIGILLLLASCSGVGQPSPSRAPLDYSACDKWPSQQTIAEHRFCEYRSRGL